METLTTTLKQTTTKDVEINVTLPYYSVDSCHWYKVIDEKHALCVCLLNGWHEIGLKPMEFAFRDTCKETIASEFDRVLDEVKKHLEL